MKWPTCTYLDPMPMPPEAAPWQLRVVAGGRDGVAGLWQSLWWEGVHRGAVSAAVVLLSLWLVVFSLGILIRGRS